MTPTARSGIAVLDSSTSNRLRAMTRDEHLAAEAALDVMSLRTPASYAALLDGWATVWQSVSTAAHEPLVCSTAREELLVVAHQALEWIAADLTDLAVHGAASGGQPAGGFAGLLERPGSTWGVAYVLRGSRLGGAVLAPIVSASVGLRAGVATSFLRSAGTDPGREWVAFRRRLDAHQLAPEQMAVAIDAARWTYARVGAELSR